MGKNVEGISDWISVAGGVVDLAGGLASLFSEDGKKRLLRLFTLGP
jgi:hypothetical protein